MQTIECSSAFKRDYKRVKAMPRHSKDLDSLVSTIVTLLLLDQALPESNRDHALSGDWAGYRECHLKPDLLLIG
jgi:mRNA interferase YafQ